jgi:putative Holliday junction resolvase
MGIDYGQKRIGIAISDELKMLAAPYKTLQNTKRSSVLIELQAMIDRENISDIVVGLPLHQDGSASKQTEQVLSFIRSLEQNLTVPVATYDERYSSAEAQKMLLKKKSSLKVLKNTIDQFAAAIILQSYLEEQRTGSSEQSR